MSIHLCLDLSARLERSRSCYLKMLQDGPAAAAASSLKAAFGLEGIVGQLLQRAVVPVDPLSP